MTSIGASSKRQVQKQNKTVSPRMNISDTRPKKAECLFPSLVLSKMLHFCTTKPVICLLCSCKNKSPIWP